MKFRTYIFLSLFLISLISCAQQKHGIRKIDAYFSMHTPGNIPVDSDGNSLYHGPTVVNVIYIETKGDPVKWVAAWKDGESFSVTTTEITERPFEVGMSKERNEKISLTPASGNKLWQVVLAKDEKLEKAPVEAKAGEIILRGKYGRKIFVQKIGKQIELEEMPSV